MNKSLFYSTLGIVLFLMLSFLIFSIPIEGGIVCLIIGFVWFSIQLFRQSEYTISKMFIVILISIVYIIVYSFFVKSIPITDIKILWTLLNFTLAFFMYTSLRSDNDRLLWENALVLFAVLVTSISVMELLHWYLMYYRSTALLDVIPAPHKAYRLSGAFFIHPNPLAGYINFIWPIIFVRLYNSKKPLQKFLFGLLLLLFVIVIIFTNSRGALLGTFASALFIFAAIFYEKGITLKKLASQLTKKKKILIGGSLGVLAFMVGSILWRSIFTGQFFNRSFSGRGTIWKFSWEAFLEKPIFGHGIGVFPIIYNRLAQLPPGDFAPSAHNLWLQISINSGMIGFLFLCGLICVFLFKGTQFLREKESGKLSFEIAYIGGGISFLTHQTVDYMLVTKTFLVVSLIMGVLILKYVVSTVEWRINRRAFLITGIFVLCLTVIYQGVVANTVMSASDYLDLKHIEENGNWTQLAEEFCKNPQDFPENALYKYECSNSLVKKMYLIDKDLDKNNLQELLDEAILYQQAAYDLNPYWGIQEANLALLKWVNDDRIEAISILSQSVQNKPNLDFLLINLGWMEEKSDNQAAALNHYKRALRLNPIMNLSDFSLTSPLFDIAAQDLVEWINSEDQWDSWYDNNRHDRGVKTRDHNYWKGVISLSMRQYESAIQFFQKSIQSGNASGNCAYLAYSYHLNGQADHAYHLAKDIATLSQSGVKEVAELSTLSMIASVLLANDEFDLAYDLFLQAFENDDGRSYQKYYHAIYSQGFLISDTSPLMIRSYLIPSEIEEDWDWFKDETIRTGDFLLADRISQWDEELSGISRIR